VLRGDARDSRSARRVGRPGVRRRGRLDCFTPDHIEADLDLFRAGPAVGLYQLRVSLPNAARLAAGHGIHRSRQSVLAYSRNKIACEERLVRAFRERSIHHNRAAFAHMTVPSSRWTVAGRWSIACARQKVIVHGDGTSLWTLPPTRFRPGLVGCSQLHAIGERAHHLDESLNWNQFSRSWPAPRTSRACACPSDVLAAYDPAGGRLLATRATA